MTFARRESENTMLTKYNDTMARRDPFDALWNAQSTLMQNIFQPLNSRYDNYRTEEFDNELLLQIDLPGVKPDDVTITTLNQDLTIEYVLRGVKCKQSYIIQRDYDATTSTAKIEHGVLEIRLPKVASSRGKKIKIDVK